MAEPVRVAPGAAERTLVWGGFPVLGVGAGCLVTAVAGWVGSLPWFPYQGPLRLVDSLDDTPATIGGIAVGVVAGLVLAVMAEDDYLKITVGPDEVTVVRGDLTRTVDRDQVEAAFLDGKTLVLLGERGREVLREQGDLNVKQVPDAFRTHGYNWLDADPYADEYRRWVEDMPGLPDGVNALLAARGRALDKGDKQDAAQLHRELARLGVVVRDEGKRQFWRTVSH